MRKRIAQSYDRSWLEIERPQNLSDRKIEGMIADILKKDLIEDISDQVYEDFKDEADIWLTCGSNTLTGLKSFERRDICIGCTQGIDTVYMSGPVQVFARDYKYHERLGSAHIFENINDLKPDTPLIISVPFPSLGNIRSDMQDILDRCLDLNIPVHIDGAWLSCSRDIVFDFSHTAIESVFMSLSKGAGLGWNRIGLRWLRKNKNDAITIMNDFNMNNRALVLIGLYFIRNLPPGYLWSAHGHHNQKVCDDFGLIPTKSIHLAFDPSTHSYVGLSPLIRFLEEHE